MVELSTRHLTCTQGGFFGPRRTRIHTLDSFPFRQVTMMVTDAARGRAPTPS